MARWSKAKREAVRERILREARRIFEAEGFEQATMRQIAKASGLAVGTVFNYFADKRVLLYAALHNDLEEVMQTCVSSMPEPEAGLEGLLVHSAGCFFDYYAERPALSRALLKESLWAQGEAGAGFRAQAQAVGEALTVRVRGLQETGQVSQAASAEHVVLAFFSHYYFILLMELTGRPNPARMRASIAALARQLLAGVGVSPLEGS